MARKVYQPPKSKLPDDASNLERILSAIPDGKATALSYARQIALRDDRYKNLMRDYDSDRKQDIGDLCMRYEISPAGFLGAVNEEAYPVVEEATKTAHMLSREIINARLPNVVKRGMIEGAKADGIADRHFTLQKEGFHVAPKGTIISMTQMNQQAAGLQSFEDSTKELNDILTVDGAIEEDDHLLTEGETEYIDVESEINADLERIPA